MPLYSDELSRLTNEWHPNAPTPHEKSVVLGAGRVLFPVDNPEEVARVLTDYALDIARRAYQAGRRQAKDEIKKAIFG